jgi:hypothetical protein
MIHKGAQRTQMVQRITQYHKAIPKPYPTIPFPNHTLYSREDPRPLVTTSSAIMIVVHFEKISTLYPRIVISSLIRRLENLIFAIFYTSFGVWPRYHYMPLPRSTLDCMSCFTIGFPFLDITQYPQAPFIVAKVFPCWISHNILKPLLHLAAL